MSSLPSDIVNLSLDAIGSPDVMGDMADGTREAQVCLRAYGQCRRQLLRAAHWDFARKTAPLLMLGDATGQTPTAGVLVALPWNYAYAYPDDCLKARFVPLVAGGPSGTPSGNIAIPTNVPLMTGLDQGRIGAGRMRTARFVIATDSNYPPDPAQAFTQVQGVSPVGRTVVLTNVKNAQLVYTCDVLYPTVWDPLFRAALVAYIAAEIAIPIWAKKDVKIGMAMRREQTVIAKQKIAEARIADGNEGNFSSDIRVDWMDKRRSGGFAGGWGVGGDGPGVLGYGWDACSFPDGSAF